MTATVSSLKSIQRVLLVGNPNTGKTTIFNALTGDHQSVGNWPGVTVEKKTGVAQCNDFNIEVTDLPGIYSLMSSVHNISQDSRIASTALLDNSYDVLVNVVDACHLERHLYLTSQLLELGKPMILVLNMCDVAERRGIEVNADALAKHLNCRVISVQAHRGIGIVDLKQAIIESNHTPRVLSLKLPAEIQQTLKTLQAYFAKSAGSNLAYYYANRCLEGDSLLTNLFDPMNSDPVLKNDADIIMADARYSAVHALTGLVQKKSTSSSDYFTARLDKIVLNRFLALPIFCCVMYCLFFFAIRVGGVLQDLFDIVTRGLLVDGTAHVLQIVHTPNWLIALCANGIGQGISTTLTFIPVIASMYFFLSFLETSGYMARAAFVIDKLMRFLGLPGKSFVPMIVGFGCNVPAVMSARILDSERDRLLTVLMSPFMSCSARLAIYSVFVAAFFPTNGQNIVFSLYLIGVLMAVFTGFILRKTIFNGKPAPLILELPSYHKPSIKRLCKETARRLRYFLQRAIQFIIPVCVVLSLLNTVSGPKSMSLLSWFGQAITPIFSPMGIQTDNWPATVGLFTGMLAKEVVIGTLNNLYGSIVNIDYFSFQSMAQYLADWWHAIIHPFQTNASSLASAPPIYGIMYEKFDGKIGAYAYLLFVLLYVPCVSTIAAIRQEASLQWMWFSVIWSTAVAYGVSVLFYQIATLMEHPWKTVIWVIGLVFPAWFIIKQFNAYYAKQNGVINAIATS